MKKQIIIHINGMMCKHCQTHVNECLNDMTELSRIKVDLENKKATAIANSENFDELFEKIKKSILDLGYQVINIEDK